MISKEEAIKQIKLSGHELIDRAESLVPNGLCDDKKFNGFTTFTVTINLVNTHTNGKIDSPNIDISYSIYNSKVIIDMIKEIYA